jgi:hypothetical protein
MKELESLFEKRGIEFDSNDNRIRCYPHIINICVQHIVSSSTTVDARNFDDETEDEEDDGGYVGGTGDHIDDRWYDESEMEEWLENVKRDPVKRARKLVRMVRSSGQRREGLSAMIKTGNQTGVFKDDKGNSVEIRDLQLVRDVRHRWSSLYAMLERIEMLQQVMCTPPHFITEF